MVLMTSLNQYLVCRNGRRHYHRRIPSAYADVDPRTYSKASLKTTSLEIARIRRDAMVEADQLYWTSLLENTNSTISPALRRYRAAKKRALAKGFVYMPAQELADTANLEEILKRLSVVSIAEKSQKSEAEAMLGGVAAAAPRLSEAFELYCNEIAATENFGKSAEQKKVWRKTKLRAVTNFCGVIGDIEMDQITRKHAQKFRSWWGERLKTTDGQKGLNPGSANRDIGNLRKLYGSFWTYEGEPDRPNPFDQMRFTGARFKEIPPFSDDFVRQKILAPGVFDGLNNEAILIVFALIETGCRPSEIANLTAENIILDHDVPHIGIRNR